MNDGLLARAMDYARAMGVRVVIVDAPAVDWYMVVQVGALVALFLDTATAHGPTCGDIVYRACEAYRRSQQITFNVTSRTVLPDKPAHV